MAPLGSGQGLDEEDTGLLYLYDMMRFTKSVKPQGEYLVDALVMAIGKSGWRTFGISLRGLKLSYPIIV